MTRELTVPDRVVLLMAVVRYLREQGEATVAELSRVFGVDEGLVRDLVVFLAGAGVPGESGTYQHEDLFDIDWFAFERDETVRLLRTVAFDDVPRFAPAETVALTAGLYALSEVLPGDDAELALATAKKLTTAFAGEDRPPILTITAEGRDARLQAIFSAMRAGTRLGFAYRDARGAETRREVDPLRLTQGEGVWYLRAFCHGRRDERVFRVDRMDDVRALETPAAHRSDGRAEREPELDGEPVVLSVRVRRDAIPLLARFDAEAQDDLGREARLGVRVGHPDSAIGVVQQAPGRVVIEGPPRSREAVREWAERALAAYDA